MVADRAQLHRVPVGLQEHARAADGELADAALAQAAADDDALRVLPPFSRRKRRIDGRELLRELSMAP